MTSAWSIKLMMCISPEHLGQISGSVPETFWMKWDQRFLNFLETGRGLGAVKDGLAVLLVGHLVLGEGGTEDILG